MTQEQVDLYIMTNQKYLPAEKIVYVKQKLTDMDETKFSLVTAVEYKDPTTLLLVSIFLGTLGIDRFMLGGDRNGRAQAAHHGGVRNPDHLRLVHHREKDTGLQLQ